MLLPGTAAAQFRRTPIFNNHYAVEFFQGPLLAPINVEALGGAATAVVDGVDGASSNAAAVEVWAGAACVGRVTSPLQRDGPTAAAPS